MYKFYHCSREILHFSNPKAIHTKFIVKHLLLSIFFYLYRDLRAALEVAINNILELLGPDTPADSDYTSDSEETPIMSGNEELTVAVRKHLAPALRDLIQHGLMPVC